MVPGPASGLGDLSENRRIAEFQPAGRPEIWQSARWVVGGDNLTARGAGIISWACLSGP